MDAAEQLAAQLQQKEEELQQVQRELKVEKGKVLWAKKDAEIKENEYKRLLDEAKEALREKQAELDKALQALNHKDMEVSALKKAAQANEEKLQKMDDMKIELEELQLLKGGLSSGGAGKGLLDTEAGSLGGLLLGVGAVGVEDDGEEEDQDKAEEVQEGMKIFDEKLKSTLSPARKEEKQRRVSFMMAKYRAQSEGGEGSPARDDAAGADDAAQEGEDRASPLKDIIDSPYNGSSTDDRRKDRDFKEVSGEVKVKRKKLVEVTKELEKKMGMIRTWEDTLKSLQVKVEEEEEKIINKVGEREQRINELELKMEELRNQNAAQAVAMEALKNEADNTKAKLAEAVNKLAVKDKALSDLLKVSEAKDEEVEVWKEEASLKRRASHELEGRVRQLDEEGARALERMRKQIQEKDAELDKLRGDAFLRGDRLEKLAREAREKTEGWQRDAENKQAMIDAKQAELDRARGDLFILAERYDALNREHEEWRGEISALRKAREGHGGDKNKVSEEEDESERLRGELGVAEQRLETQRRELQESIEKWQHEAEELRGLLEERQGELDAVRSVLDLSGEKVEMQQKELQERAENWKKDMDSKQALIDELQERLNKANEDHSLPGEDGDGRLENLRKEHEHARADLDWARGCLYIAEEKLQHNLREFEQKGREWHEQKEGLHQEIERKKAELDWARGRLYITEETLDQKGRELQTMIKGSADGEMTKPHDTLEERERGEQALKQQYRDKVRRRKIMLKELKKEFEAKSRLMREEMEKERAQAEEAAERLREEMEGAHREREKEEERSQGLAAELTKELDDVKADLFYSLAIAIKLNLSNRGLMCNQNIMGLYEIAQQQKVGYKDWNKWLHERLNSRGG